MNRQIMLAFAFAAGLSSTVPIGSALGASLASSGSYLANAVGNTGTAAKHADYSGNNHSVRPFGEPTRTALYVGGELSLYGAARIPRKETEAR